MALRTPQHSSGSNPNHLAHILAGASLIIGLGGVVALKSATSVSSDRVEFAP
jgi:hypothetical protein